MNLNFHSGLCGLKLHAHVQCFDMNAAAMEPLYDCCQSNAKPVVMHVGRQPKSEAYRCDLDRICSAEKLDRVMYGSDFPNIPYAWDRELKRLLRSGLSDAGLEWVACKSACGFFGLGFFQG